VLVVVVIVLGVLASAAVIAQFAIPRIAEGRVRAALTRGGGSADVEIAAFPATRLLRNRGDLLVVRGQGLEIGMGGGGPEPQRPAGLAALDGFGHVDIELVDFRTGPFSIAAFVLERHGAESYALATKGTTSAAELARLGEGLLRGLPAAPALGSVASGLPSLPLSSREVSISVEVELISDGGRLTVGSGGGSIAGYPAGPIASGIAAAVARRLEITP